MKKYRIELSEQLTYRREFVIEVPDDVTDGELDHALDRAQHEEFAEDTSYKVVQTILGSKIVEYVDNSLSSPLSGEVEIDSFELVKED